MEKYFRAGQTTTNNTAHAHFMLNYLRLQIHTQNKQCLLVLHCNSGCTNAPPCYVKPTLPVLLIITPCKLLLAMHYDNKFNYRASIARSENKLSLYKRSLKAYAALYIIVSNDEHFY